jgi:hypothetical protein
MSSCQLIYQDKSTLHAYDLYETCKEKKNINSMHEWSLVHDKQRQKKIRSTANPGEMGSNWLRSLTNHNHNHSVGKLQLRFVWFSCIWFYQHSWVIWKNFFQKGYKYSTTGLIVAR